MSGPATFSGSTQAVVSTGADGRASVAAQATASAGDVSVTASAAGVGGLALFAPMHVVPLAQGPGPKPSADTSVTLAAPKVIKRGRSGDLRVTIANLGPGTSGAWTARVAVGRGLTITRTSQSGAGGRYVTLTGPAFAAKDTATSSVTVRALHRG